MGKRLLGKFTRAFFGIVALLLATGPVAVLAQSPVGACQHPEPPVITGSATSICRHESVTLSATGCTGTVVWSNGETGSTISVKPQQTTKYTAICRARPGCISCFADVWKVTVNTPDAPTIRSSATHLCSGDTLTLTATNCSGVVRWTDQTTGPRWTGTLTQTTAFRATCEQNGCFSTVSEAVLVQIGVPTVPAVSADKTTICAGQAVQLTASTCVGSVRWSDGGEGVVRTVRPVQPATYRAICQTGSCRSDSSNQVAIVVQPLGRPPAVASSISNGCPFQTADLSNALVTGNEPISALRYVFLTSPTPDAPPVQSPGAVLAGTYYIVGRTADGCYTDPSAVTVRITPCQNAIPPCLSNPPTVAVRLDSLDWAKGVVRLAARLGGSAERADWQSSGGGLFTDTGLNARYLLSETDRQLGVVTFTVSAPDPDGGGPCLGALTKLTVRAPALSPELVGLSKKVSEPVWITDGASRLVELTYQFTVVNAGTHTVSNLQVSDDLDATFAVAGARVSQTTIRADSGLVVNPAYTGLGADTLLTTAASQLPAARRGRIWLTLKVDVSQANTLTFSNEANVVALDANGMRCRDRSTNGTDPDPDRNGNPADNSEPTRITLHSLQPGEGETVFIPDGFSPNGDGINDRFVIQRVPPGVTVQLEIYNRWGHLVYQQPTYENDWDGTANQGINRSGAKQMLPDGTYYYQIRLSDGREFVRFITLAR